MINLQGRAYGVLRDINTGEITKTFEFDNHIQDRFLLDMADINPSFLEQNLFVSELNPGEQRRDWGSSIGGNARRGDDISGVTKREITIDYAPGIHLGQWVQRFDAPAADYTINLVGLCSNVSGGVTSTACAVVWLSTPCIQTTTETLDLYYRVQLKFDENWESFGPNDKSLNGFEAKRLAQYIFSGANGYLLSQSLYPMYNAMAKYNPRILSEQNPHDAQSTYCHMPDNDTFTLDSDAFGSTFKISNGINDNIGKLIGTIANASQGLNFKMYTQGESPVQSIFGHRDTSETPFYNAAHAQLGLGSLDINGDLWTDPDYPKFFRMDITTSGLLNVGEYKFRMRSHFGLKDNTYFNIGCPLQWSNYWSSPAYTGGMTLCHDDMTFGKTQTYEEGAYTSYPRKYDDDHVVFVDKDRFAFMNIIDATGEFFDNNTLVGLDVVPRFLATDIGQVTFAGDGSILIACRSTGVYKFDAARDVLTVIDSSTPGLTGVLGCLGLTYGNGGRLWGYWNHPTTPTLYYSDDNGANWTATTLTDVFLDANPTRVVAIKADPNDVNGKLGILYQLDAPGTNGRISVKWWDQLSTTVSDGPTHVGYMADTTFFEPFRIQANHFYGYQELLDCSPNDSVWAIASYRTSYTAQGNVAFLAFGTTTLDNVSTTVDINTRQFAISWVQDGANKDYVYYLAIEGEDNNQGNITGTHAVLLDPLDTTQPAEFERITDNSNFFEGEMSWFHLKDGVWLNCYINQNNNTSLNYQNYFFLISAVPVSTNFANSPIMFDLTFPEYGWDGANWVKGHANGKPLHAAAEELLDGVTVSWDDNAGTTPFLDSDHYTVGVCDGIWVDGSTTFDWKWTLYVKPSVENTEVEAAILPATTKVSNQMIVTQLSDDADYTDLLSTSTNNIAGRLVATGTGLQGDYNSGARSLNPVIRGDANSFLPNATFVPDTEINNAQGWMDARIYYNASQHVEHYVGLSPFDRLGTTLDEDTIAYAFHVDSVTPGNGVGTCRLRVVENGIERATVDGLEYSTGNATLYLRIVLLTNGSIAYLYKQENTTWFELYRAPAGSITVENLYLDTAYVPASGRGLWELTYNSLDVDNPDYYLYLGDGVDQGIFNPEFVIIDSESLTVTIDGTEAVNVGNDDTVTVLPANTYSLYPTSGVIRYSASDVGKSVSASYITIANE